MNKITLDIAGMHCRSCELATEEKILGVSGVKKARTNFQAGRAEIFYEHENEKPDIRLLEKAIQDAGYTLGVGNRENRPWISSDAAGWVEFLFALGIVFLLFLFATGFGLFDISLGSAERLSSVPFVFLLGMVAGLSTCMAMVGGLVLAVAARFNECHPEANIRQKFLPNVYFNLGRVGGFAFFGALLGWIGSTFQLSSFSVGTLTVVVSVVMLFIGLQLLELFPRLSVWKLTLPKALSRVLGISSHSKKEYSHGRAMLLGAATFFLPCGFTQVVQLYVVSVGSPLIGALSMGMFALGTAPGLLGIGGIAAAAKGVFRRFFFKTAGLIVIGLGIFNFHNGVSLLGFGPRSQLSGEAGGELSGVLEGNVQVIRIVQNMNGYFPNHLTVKKGKLVRLIIDSQESFTCASSFAMPQMGILETLSPGENTFEFMPEKSGAIPFSCSMGMFRGTLTVVE